MIQPAVWFDYNDGYLSVTQWNIDDESDWYLVQPGDALHSGTVAAGQFPILFTTDTPRPPVFVGTSGEFYLGVGTRWMNGPGPPPVFRARLNYGWVRIQNFFGQLTMLDNAVSYGGAGIIVGTSTPAPEPATTGLIAAAVMMGAMSFRIRRRNAVE
jgi:hypothetical protein